MVSELDEGIASDAFDAALGEAPRSDAAAGSASLAGDVANAPTVRVEGGGGDAGSALGSVGLAEDTPNAAAALDGQVIDTAADALRGALDIADQLPAF